MGKTVFFLGAGFSADAGGPIQNDIIKWILDEKFLEQFKYEQTVVSARENFIRFIEKDLEINEKLWNNIALEDIFTPIDRAVVNNRSFKNFDIKKLVNLREEFHFLMGVAIHYGVDYNRKDDQYIDDFAKKLNEVAKKRLKNIANDNVSIISSNWDLLLDNSLNKILQQYCAEEKVLKSEKIAVVDYCCYISSLQNDDFIKPGLFALGLGGYNIKYLKLHGSMNWLHCPNCQRMYIKYDVKTMLTRDKYCKHCKKNYSINNENSIKLKSNLMLPTFIKDYSNIQIQLVWQNAGIELAEASKVVFIGYSLPPADFEIRQLLSRSIPRTAEVDVVIYPSDSFKENPVKLEELKNNYKTFFGSRIRDDRNFIIKSVPDFINSLTIEI